VVYPQGFEDGASRAGKRKNATEGLEEFPSGGRNRLPGEQRDIPSTGIILGEQLMKSQLLSHSLPQSGENNATINVNRAASTEKIAPPAHQLHAMAPPLSQSRREKMACPHLYQITTIDRVPTPESVPARRGQELHKLLSTYVQYCWKSRQQTDYAFLETLNLGACREALDLFRAIGQDLIIDHERILGVEMKLALDADLNPVHRHDWSCFGFSERDVPIVNAPRLCNLAEAEAHFESTLDLVHLPTADEAVIDDWKSNWAIFKADTFQSQLYPLQVFMHFPSVERVTFRLRFVRYGLAAVREVEFIRERDLDWLKRRALDERDRQLVMHASAASGEKLRALPGDHCAWCPRAQQCPVREINPFTSQDPQELLQFARWAQGVLYQAKQVLKALVDANGPIMVEDANGNELVADFRKHEKRRYPVVDCLPVVRDWDRDSREGLTENLTLGGLTGKLKAKKRAGLREQLDALAIMVPETRFTIGGVEEEVEDED
jgi:hypothetical protein